MHRPAPPANAAETVGRFIERLAAVDVAADALAVGQQAPDFVLPNAENRLVSAAEIWPQGPTVFCFIRGNWCQFCAAHLEKLKLAAPEIAAAGGRIVIVTPETGGSAARLKARRGLDFEILCDVDGGLALACGLLFRLSGEMCELYEKLGRVLPAFQGNDGWFLPVPASYVIDRRGVVRAAHVNVDYRERMPTHEMVAAVAAARASG